jgi:4-diphosphocytidyl-2-C-methyl-D-erythritol kinase
LGLSEADLLYYAAKLGSDCAFFIINKPCLGTGRGEKLEPFDLDLSAYRIVIVYPGIHINTGRAFLNIRPSVSDTPIRDILKKPVSRWKDELFNDFESRVFNDYREVVEIKDQLYIAGAEFASMSGSGSTVYGIFKRDHKISLNFPEHYFVKELTGQLQ